MKYVVIVIILIWVVFFVFMNMADRKRKKKEPGREEKPLFRTEDDLEEYGKPMDSHPVNFDDEE